MSSQHIGNGDKVGKGLAGRAVGLVAVVAVLLLVAAACGSSSTKGSGAGDATTVRVGYFPNITHAPALVGIDEGILARDLAPDRLDGSQTFNAGPAEVQALLSGSIDIAFIGPSPAVSAYASSHGAVQIIAGAASGGAALVVKPSITAPAQLKGTTLASPQLGNTQDVALKYWLSQQGLSHGVTVQPSTSGNGTIVTELRSGAIAGAWVPEPYVAEMVADGGHVLVDEKTLWPERPGAGSGPGGQFSTTEVAARTSFVRQHPATVQRFLTGLVDTLAAITSDPAGAQQAANAQLTKLTSKPLPAKTLTSAWSDLTFTDDPLAASVQTQTDHAVSIGAIKNPGNLAGLYELAPLNQVLAAKGRPPVSAP